MLSFYTHRNGQAVKQADLAGAHLIGSDGVPLRAEMEFKDAKIVCAKRQDGAAALVLLWPIKGCGALLVETSRLMDRETPYNLTLELVRGRLTKINQKREDWGLFDYEGVEPVAVQINEARDLFIEALKEDSLEAQSNLAEDALTRAYMAGEQLSHFHADLFLARRKQLRNFTKRVFGCTLDLSAASEKYGKHFRECFDFAHVPLNWRMIEPRPQEQEWGLLDGWVEWLTRARMPIKMGPLISFDGNRLPDWLTQYEGDFETVRNVLFDHVRRVVTRYGKSVFHWDVISGAHAVNTFNFTFEQLMELTRVTVSLVKQMVPKAQVAIDLTYPWGEYYARNQRTIPPLFYADMVAQSGVGFDGVGVQMIFGAPVDGMYVRDMFQISEKLDRLGNLGKSIHITAVQVPSSPTNGGKASGGGCWLKPWDEQVQAQWLKEFYTIALSKPFVETITWRDLADRPEDGHPITSGGLLKQDLTPKLSYKVLKELRADLHAVLRRAPAQPRPQ